MVVLIDKQAHQEQINQMLDALESYIKVVVDVERKTLAGGGEFHVDCEQILLDNGSEQKDLWGGGVDWENQQVEFNSLINIRPAQGNPSQEILSPQTREKFEKIIKKLLGL